MSFGCCVVVLCCCIFCFDEQLQFFFHSHLVVWCYCSICWSGLLDSSSEVMICIVIDVLCWIDFHRLCCDVSASLIFAYLSLIQSVSYIVAKLCDEATPNLNRNWLIYDITYQNNYLVSKSISPHYTKTLSFYCSLLLSSSFSTSIFNNICSYIQKLKRHSRFSRIIIENKTMILELWQIRYVWEFSTNNSF